jgi:glycosyltransferase involved in cell wall biosynthesis
MGRYLGRMRTARLISHLKAGLRTALGPLLPWVRSMRTLPKRLRAERHATALYGDAGISVCYLTSQFPARPALRTEIAHGGAVKLTFLAEHFPHSYPRASLLYTVSSVDHVAKAAIVHKAKQNGLKVILNQNGVAYPAWHGQGWEEPNRKMKDIYRLADFIIYQSKFCRLGALKFLGASEPPFQIIYNPVDTNLYRPARKPTGHRGPVLLLGGNQYERYRFETALRVFKHTLTLLPNASLIITGKLWGENQLISMDIANRILRELDLEDYVEFTGAYSQEAAPGIFQRADILMHTKYNDPSPNLISEALASGLPVVYSASGGVPELVGPDAGIGIEVEQSWDKISQPDPQLMAEAILKVWENELGFSEAARQRAVEQFHLGRFIQIHRELFARILE